MSLTLPKRYFSWKDVETACLYLKQCLNNDNFKPDYIVGLTRGGLIPAVMLSHMIKTKFVALDVSLRDGVDGPTSNLWLPETVMEDNVKVLIVDDINDSGATFNWIKNDWEQTTFNKSFKWGNIRFAVLVHNESSETYSDYSFLKINKTLKDTWVVYPWEQQ